MVRRSPPGSGPLADQTRAAITLMQDRYDLEPDPARRRLIAAVADLLTYEVDTRHEIIGAARRGVLGGTAVMCSCGGMSVQAEKIPLPCGRLQRAHAVAMAYLEGNDHGQDIPRRSIRGTRRAGRR